MESRESVTTRQALNSQSLRGIPKMTIRLYTWNVRTMLFSFPASFVLSMHLLRFLSSLVRVGCFVPTHFSSFNFYRDQFPIFHIFFGNLLEFISSLQLSVHAKVVHFIFSLFQLFYSPCPTYFLICYLVNKLF